MPESISDSPQEEASVFEELERYRFMARLDEALWPLISPEEITCTAASILGRHLAVHRCAYAHVDDATDTFLLTGNYTDGVPSIVGRYDMAAFGAEFVRLNRSGLPYVVDDVETDLRVRDVLRSYRDTGIRAVVSVPIIKDGKMVAGMALHQSVPRHWQAKEIKMLEAVANRCWESIERMRIAARLGNVEKEVRKSRDYLRLLINCTEEGFYSVDRNGVTIMCNAAFLKMLGFEREEDAVGRKLHDIIHHTRPDGSPYHACDCPIYHAAQYGTPAHVEDEAFFRVDGTAFPVEYRARPVWQDGQLSGAVCTFVDLTDRRRTEKALQESEAHLRSLFDQTGAGFCEVDPTGRIIRVNDRYCNIVARSRAELLGMYMQDLTHAEDLVPNLPLFKRAVEFGEPFEIEKRYLRPDGSTVWVSNTVSPIRNVTDGSINSLLAVSVDISQRKRVEEALMEADRRKDEFLAMLAHELRNPMAPIRAAADLMEVAHLDPEQLQRTSQIISRQVRHMTSLVDDLLDVSRVTRGLVTLDRTDIDVKQVITDALEQVRPLVEAKRHHLTLDLDPEPAHVVGDHKRLVQILTNLLNNAAKYTPSGGTIRLSMQASPESVFLHVADNGTGIPAELQPRIFDLFAQAARSPDRAQGGLGIGLALVKSLVELHGGGVRCESEGAGKGSCFVVTLPRVQKSDTADSQQGPELARPPATRRRILIVDDNEDAANMLAMLLEVAGHEVFVVYSAAIALERAKDVSPDVCVLDIGLPEMDGYTLARMLRSRAQTAQSILIAVTGYGQHQDREQTADAGFDHHLVKPVDTGELLALVDAAVSRRPSARQ
ncbi:PAS domain S-box protein [Massilia sp. METH4]|uniref:hybrid sensor histidine kinase/response regulator n=1 Tax=Massilia sp. METH4 TaxID=3123041 RepID=UPI0030CA9950